jgi:hypothetical protein
LLFWLPFKNKQIFYSRLTHDPENKKHVCSICNYKTFQKSNLKAHMNTHANEQRRAQKLARSISSKKRAPAPICAPSPAASPAVRPIKLEPVSLELPQIIFDPPTTPLAPLQPQKIMKPLVVESQQLKETSPSKSSDFMLKKEDLDSTIPKFDFLAGPEFDLEPAPQPDPNDELWSLLGFDFSFDSTESIFSSPSPSMDLPCLMTSEPGPFESPVADEMDPWESF